MSHFQPPNYTDDKDYLWRAVAKPGFQDSRHLWKDYWQRFNTINIPLLDPDAYFAHTLAAAREAQTREHLEEPLAERALDRRKELEEAVAKLANASFWARTRFPSWNARVAALRLADSGSLNHFIAVVAGVVWSWGDNDRADINHRRDASSSGQGVELASPEREYDSGTQELPHYPKAEIDDESSLLFEGIHPGQRVSVTPPGSSDGQDKDSLPRSAKQSAHPKPSQAADGQHRSIARHEGSGRKRTLSEIVDGACEYKTPKRRGREPPAASR